MLLLLCAGGLLSAGEGAHALVFSLTANDGRGIDLYRTATSLEYSYDSPRLTARSGVQSASKITDFTLQAAYFPVIFKKMCLGAGALYHYGDMGFAREQDFYTGLYVRFRPVRFFNMGADVSFTLKITRIPALPKDHQEFTDRGIAVAFRFSSDITSRIRVEFDISSYDLYRHSLFLNPLFALTGTYVFRNRCFAAFTLAAQYSDLFTLTSYLGSAFIRPAIGIIL